MLENVVKRSKFGYTREQRYTEVIYYYIILYYYYYYFIIIIISFTEMKCGQSFQELCESGSGRPGLAVPTKPDAFCGRKATQKRK